MADQDTSFYWLHLSDFHRGQPKVDALWNDVEDLFLRDLAEQLEKLSKPIDLIFLTGDMAFSGRREEFEKFDRFLALLLRTLRRRGAAPLVFAVPGNHDLARPKGTDALWCRALDDFDQGDNSHAATLKEAFWNRRDVSLLTPPFAEYLTWSASRMPGLLVGAPGTATQSAPAVSCASYLSYFPGDWSAVVEKDGFRLGLIGLNSAWAQYSGADFRGKLQLCREQFQAALPTRQDRGNVLEFFPGHGEDSVHRAVLLLHHPPDWLSPHALSEFDQSIYPPGRFEVLLSGHIHEARSELRAVSGGAPRRLFQAPSLFGLEHHGLAKEKRAFGYALGSITRSGEVVVWPRKVVARGTGAQAFDVDQSFERRPADDGVLLREGEPLLAPRVPPSGRSAARKNSIEEQTPTPSAGARCAVSEAGNPFAAPPPRPEPVDGIRPRPAGHASSGSSTELIGEIDIGILTIREDDFRAVLEASASEKMSKEQFSQFTVSVGEPEWDPSLNGWRRPAMNIPGARLLAFYLNGEKAESFPTATVQFEHDVLKWKKGIPSSFSAGAVIALTRDLATEFPALEDAKVELLREKIRLKNLKSIWQALALLLWFVGTLAGAFLPRLLGEHANRNDAPHSTADAPSAGEGAAQTPGRRDLSLCSTIATALQRHSDTHAKRLENLQTQLSEAQKAAQEASYGQRRTTKESADRSLSVIQNENETYDSQLVKLQKLLASTGCAR